MPPAAEDNSPPNAIAAPAPAYEAGLRGTYYERCKSRGATSRRGVWVLRAPVAGEGQSGFVGFDELATAVESVTTTWPISSSWPRSSATQRPSRHCQRQLSRPTGFTRRHEHVLGGLRLLAWPNIGDSNSHAILMVSRFTHYRDKFVCNFAYVHDFHAEYTRML